jgi:hypothetical protein
MRASGHRYHGDIHPANSGTAKASEVTSCRVWVTISSRAGRRAATMLPARRLKIRKGMNWAATTTDRSSPFPWATWMASQ